MLSITLEELAALLAEGLATADDSVRLAWEKMRIHPEKWRLSPWGDDQGGFWVVAETAGSVVWFNDIEEGFNTSRFDTRGVIGEYKCQQEGFADFLSRLPEALAEEGFADAARALDVPVALMGPGAIARRQTTYWELLPTAGDPCRVHVSGKQEQRFVVPNYERALLANQHPVLVDYHEPWANVFVSRAQHCGPSLVEALADTIEKASMGWRTFRHYAWTWHHTLAAGNGLLLDAPQSIAAIARDVVRAFGAGSTVIPSRPARLGMHVLVLGPNFLVGRAFRFT